MNKLVHMASFSGNIGDIINHQGFYNALNIDKDIITEIEMRQFYRRCGKNRKKFDSKLADEINQYDALILGGGGFFNIYFDESITGTTVDAAEDFINSISVPVVVNAMGVHVDRTKKIAINKFKDFIDIISKKDNWFVSIRNDGSSKRMTELYGDDVLERIHIVPDNGFVFRHEKNVKIDLDKKMIGLSLTNEMINPYFTHGMTNDDFNKKIANFVEQLLNMNFGCCFFIHTPQDINTLNCVMGYCGQEKFRNNVIVAPYAPFTSDKILNEFMDYYLHCELVIGMRFHSNVLSIANNIPVIGLAIHEQITDLYEQIHLIDHCIRIGEDNWLEKLTDKTFSLIENRDMYLKEQEKAENEIILQHKKYMQYLNSFLNV